MDTLSYFASQSALTDLGGYAEQVAALPADVAGICQAIRGLFLDYRERCKYPIVNERLLCTNARYAGAILAWVLKLSKAPLTEARSEENRFTATSSDYANLFVAVARAKGIPARKRVGFVGGDTWEIAEYWDGSAWQKVDPSGLTDTAKFMPAAQAWQACRAGKGDPEGHKSDSNEKLTGWAVLRNSLMLDLAAMNKVELLNWDRYGWMNRCICELSDRAWEILDQTASVLAAADEDLDAVHALYDAQEGLQAPRVIWCDSPVVPPHKVELTF